MSRQTFTIPGRLPGRNEVTRADRGNLIFTYTLGLDLSLTHTGWCLLADDGDYSCGSIVPKKLRGMERIEYIVAALDELLSGAWNVTRINIEGYSFGSRGSAVFDVAELGGIVRWHLHTLGYEYRIVSPSSLKKAATGKGNADKGAMLAAAIRKHGYEGSDHNEADAIHLAHYGEGAAQ